jgi:hypothetical protein
MKEIQLINESIQKLSDRGSISDGYHTFNELYEHRITLYIAICKKKAGEDNVPFGAPFDSYPVWRSKVHSDGSIWDDWFLLGINYKKGEQITYHLPMSRWNECSFADELDKAPEFDGHTSADVLERLKNIW